MAFQSYKKPHPYHIRVEAEASRLFKTLNIKKHQAAGDHLIVCRRARLKQMARLFKLARMATGLKVEDARRFD